MTTNSSAAFITHQHYLKAFELIATRGCTNISEAYGKICENFRLTSIPIQGKKVIESQEQVRKSLENAWGTECLLLLSNKLIETDELVRISNNWNVIQGYYALYHVTQALLVSRGYKRPETHPKTLILFYDYWGRLPVNYSPWSLTVGYSGCNHKDVEIDTSIHAWTSVGLNTYWSIACKALRTTRNYALEERLRDARETKRKNKQKAWKDSHPNNKNAKGRKINEPQYPLSLLSSEEKKGICTSFRGFTLLDYLYRLRMHSNYIDTEMFTDGPIEESESFKVRRSILRIIQTSLYASELMLCKHLNGRKNLLEWAANWDKRNIPSDLQLGVTERMEYWS